MNKILIIEDDIELTKALKKYLEGAGFEVLNINTPEDMFNILLGNKIEIILLDIMLPEKSGLELLEYLKNNEDTKNIPVIILTNLDDDLYKNEAMEKGAIDFFLKAETSLEDLESKIKKVLGY